MRPRDLGADEALVENAGVAVGAARGASDVPVAHPAAGRDGGRDLVEAVGIHVVLLCSVSRPPTLRPIAAVTCVCGRFVAVSVHGRDEASGMRAGRPRTAAAGEGRSGWRRQFGPGGRLTAGVGT